MTQSTSGYTYISIIIYQPRGEGTGMMNQKSQAQLDILLAQAKAEEQSADAVVYLHSGTIARIVADCGLCQPRYLAAPSRLVQVIAIDDPTWTRYQFLHTLRASGGLKRLTELADAAPKVTLRGKALAQAYKQAE